MTSVTPPFPWSRLRSKIKVRSLSAESLGLWSSPLALELDKSDQTIVVIEKLLKDGFGGVILSGPPGTSKSWYARQIAIYLADRNPERVRFIQFHSSYQYEDFVEGYIPTEKGFVLSEKHLLEMCAIAKKHNGERCVLVIDELSRVDPSRVFGEALTYVEKTKRNHLFRLASGRLMSIPENLVFIATMNQLDRGVDEVDMAFERRFAKIAMEPSIEILERFLTKNNMPDQLKKKVLIFFRALQNDINPYCKIGHAYFHSIHEVDELRRLWDYQLQFHFEKAFKLDPEGMNRIKRFWEKIFDTSEGTRDV